MSTEEKNKKYEIKKIVPLFSNNENSMDEVEISIKFDILLKQFTFPYPSDLKINIDSIVEELIQYKDSLMKLSGYPNSARILSSEINNNASLKTINITLSIERNNNIPLADFISKEKLNLDTIIKFLRQSLVFLMSATKENYVFSDIKIDDFFIDSEENLNYFGYSFPQIDLNSNTVYYKNFPLYSSPELLNKEKSPLNIHKENNKIKDTIIFEINKYQIYSWGIFAYFLIGGQPIINKSLYIDELKLFPEGYSNLLEAIDSLQKDGNPEIIGNIKSIIKNTIDYHPENRLNFYHINKLFENLDAHPEGFIKKINKFIIIQQNMISEKLNKGKTDKKNTLNNNSLQNLIPLSHSEISEEGSNVTPYNENISLNENKKGTDKQDNSTNKIEIYKEPFSQKYNKYPTINLENNPLRQSTNIPIDPKQLFSQGENFRPNSAFEYDIYKTENLSNNEVKNENFENKKDTSNYNLPPLFNPQSLNSLDQNFNNNNPSFNQRRTHYHLKLRQSNSYNASVIVEPKSNVNGDNEPKIDDVSPDKISENSAEEENDSEESSDDNGAKKEEEDLNYNKLLYLESKKSMNIGNQTIQSLKFSEIEGIENYSNPFVENILNQYKNNKPFDINFPGFHMAVKDLHRIKNEVNHPTLINSIIINKYDYFSNNYLVKNLNLAKEDFEIILDLIHFSISLMQISLDGISIGNPSQEFLKDFNKLANLKILNLMNCGINGPIIINILNEISQSSLEVLDIGNNNLESKHFWEITRILNTKHKTLSTLFIQANNIEFEGAKKWEENFLLNKSESWNLKLSEFNISSNFIGSNGLKSIKGLLSNYNSASKLTKFYVGGNNLGDDGARILQYILSFLADLRVLFVNNNQITSDGASSICKGLNKKKSLTYFDISDNYIENDGVFEVGKVMKNQPNLINLSVRNNNLYYDSIHELIKRFSKRKEGHALNIDISSNYLLDTDKRKLRKLVKDYIRGVIIIYK